MQNNKRKTSGSQTRTGSVRRGQSRRGRAWSMSPAQRMIAGLRRFLAKPRNKLIAGGVALALVLLIAGINALANRETQPDVVHAPVTVAVAAEKTQSTPLATAVVTTVSAVQPTDTTATTTTATTATAAPQSAATTNANLPDYLAHNPETWQDGEYVPDPLSYRYLPVFSKADREDKVIAITVDDCFQFSNLKQIIELAEGVGGKLTIFPIGKLLQRKELQEIIRYAHSIGFEIENHTLNHDGLYNYQATSLAKVIFDQDRAVDYVLGVNYYTHFLRPMGGDDRNDLRTHSYIKQLGYYGIAHWSVDGKESIEYLKKHLAPGAVYLFHCTNKDLAKLKEFIPYAVQQGYQLLTFNELFGYQANYEEPLTDDVAAREIIQLEPYERDYRKIRPTTYEYAAWEIQEKLIEKGFMTGKPDGIYGKGTAKCAAAWQKSQGFEGDGVLTHDQQLILFDVK